MVKQDYLEAIRRFEGFSPVAKWDYAQSSNGYGTKARFAGEVIDPAEADRRFTDEIGKAKAAVLAFQPNLDAGSVAALTSLTFNAGTAWMKSGLGAAVKAGDLEGARGKILEYVNAGGKMLPGLLARREVEAQWIGQQPSPTETGRGDAIIQASALNARAPTPSALPPSLVPVPQPSTVDVGVLPRDVISPVRVGSLSLGADRLGNSDASSEPAPRSVRASFDVANSPGTAALANALNLVLFMNGHVHRKLLDDAGGLMDSSVGTSA